MNKKNMNDQDDNTKKILAEETTGITETIDYVTRYKVILTESKASKSLIEKLLKVILEMRQEMNSKTELIDTLTKDRDANAANNNSNKVILTKLDEIAKSLVTKTYRQATSIGPDVKLSEPQSNKKNVVEQTHTFKIYPEADDAKISIIETKELLRPHLQKHPVNKIRKVRNGGILIELANKSSIPEITETIKKNMKKPIKIIGDKIRRPQFIIKGISSDDAEKEPEELISLFKKQNNIPETANISHKTFINLRSGDKHWIVETDGPTSRALLKNQRVYLEFTRHVIEENFFIPTCTHCRGIGHIKKYSKLSISVQLSDTSICD